MRNKQMNRILELIMKIDRRCGEEDNILNILTDMELESGMEIDDLDTLEECLEYENMISEGDLDYGKPNYS